MLNDGCGSENQDVVWHKTLSVTHHMPVRQQAKNKIEQPNEGLQMHFYFRIYHWTMRGFLLLLLLPVFVAEARSHDPRGWVV